MDDVHYTAWREARAPFDGTTTYTVDFLTLAKALTLLRPVVSSLHRQYGSEQLLTYHDWHEHDGIIQPARPTEWGQLVQLLQSESDLVKASHGDYQVSSAFFPESRSFLLRIYIDDDFVCAEKRDLANDRCVYFDLTCEVESLNEVIVPEEGAIELESAKSYFDRRYAGDPKL
jgi:hypothetical protein